MAYTKQNFTNGKVLDATQLNMIEDGIVAAHNTITGIFDSYDNFYDSIARMRVNPVTHLEIPTYDGSGQLTHPCVRYFPEGFGGHQFWMTASPYPYSALDLENPCVWYSDDGYNWSADGIPNPLDLPLMVDGEQASMNSDPHLLLRTDGVMEVWWRTNYWENSGEGLYTVVYRRTSTDSIHWTEKEELYRALTDSDASIVCPVALYEDGVYKIWAVSDQECLHYYESAAGKAWQHIRDIDVGSPDYPEYKVWHFDVNHTDKGYEFVGSYNIPGDYNAHKYIYYAVSDDNITYSERVMILVRGVARSFDERLLYRPTIIRLDNKVMVYYGANDANNAWHVGMIEAPNPYLFNAVLRTGEQFMALWERVGNMERRTANIAEMGVSTVRNWEDSQWHMGYWNPGSGGAIENTAQMHHSDLMPIINLYDNGRLFTATVANTRDVPYQLMRVNWFTADGRWLGFDSGNGFNVDGFVQPFVFTPPTNASYFAFSANTESKSDIAFSVV